MVIEEHAYAVRDGGPLKLRVVRPTGDADYATAVLHLHGGGWRSGSPELLDQRSAALAARGYTVIQLQYRLLRSTVRWPAPVSDLRSALRWVWGHADDLGVQSDSIAVWGHSAGAHITLMTAAMRSHEGLDHPDDDLAAPISMAALIDCYGPVSFCSGDVPLLVVGPDGPDLEAIAANQRPDGALPGLDLLGEPCSVQQAAAISPLGIIDSTFPPTMIVHGTEDRLILPANSERLARALSELGVVCELVTFAHCGHEFDTSPSYADVVAAHIDVFLRRVLEEKSLAAEIAEHAMFR